MSTAQPRTFFEKAWNHHAIAGLGENTHLLQVDRLLLHDVTGDVAMRDFAAVFRDEEAFLASLIEQFPLE